MDKRMIAEAMMINEASKRGPKHPSRPNRAKYHGLGQSIKTQHSQNEKEITAEAATFWLWCLPQSARGNPLPPESFIFLRGCSIATQFRPLNASSLCIKALYLAAKRGLFHHCHLHNTVKTSLDIIIWEIEKRRKKI